MANAQPEQQTIKGHAAAIIHSIEEIGGRSFAETFPFVQRRQTRRLMILQLSFIRNCQPAVKPKRGGCVVCVDKELLVFLPGILYNLFLS